MGDWINSMSMKRTVQGSNHGVYNSYVTCTYSLPTLSRNLRFVGLWSPFPPKCGVGLWKLIVRPASYSIELRPPTPTLRVPIGPVEYRPQHPEFGRWEDQRIILLRLFERKSLQTVRKILMILIIDHCPYPMDIYIYLWWLWKVWIRWPRWPSRWPRWRDQPSHFGEIHQSASSPQGLQSHFQRWIAAAGFIDLAGGGGNPWGTWSEPVRTSLDQWQSPRSPSKIVGKWMFIPPGCTVS